MIYNACCWSWSSLSLILHCNLAVKTLVVTCHSLCCVGMNFTSGGIYIRRWLWSSFKKVFRCWEALCWYYRITIWLALLFVKNDFSNNGRSIGSFKYRLTHCSDAGKCSDSHLKKLVVMTSSLLLIISIYRILFSKKILFVIKRVVSFCYLHHVFIYLHYLIRVCSTINSIEMVVRTRRDFNI